MKLSVQISEPTYCWKGRKRDKRESKAVDIFHWPRPMRCCVRTEHGNYQSTSFFVRQSDTCFDARRLTRILNKLSHSESYDFSQGMETALAKALDEVAIHLTPEIVKGKGNIVFQCEWDNLNNTTSSVHGSNIVSSAKDIMVQEVNPEFENSDVRTLPVIDKSPQRSLKVDTPRESTIEYFTPGGEDPVTEIKPPATYRAKCQRQYSCTLVVYTASTAAGIVNVRPPGNLGPTRVNVKGFRFAIHQPITDSSLVRELLKRSEDATAKVGQK